ncbi:MAG: bifunctional diaminohydroxyphosphoribosylaminopyrimidine deaminase/5-amino-6-(5-phosphoribosylamino)uracil reductase RibD [Gammaproteobacteria bacterium]|nr:bifunctional diaminohydroxyphosphoribosylaminopyrimidine deaminase/5-amino-6-(5-phosphoribosylamino)uracil reductase RibD [Gammaproteobacteria bacterium]
MSRALQLAQRGLYTTHPNPRVGCVLAKAGAIVGEGWHEKAGEPHAEINALRQAGEKAAGATAYVTLEPCSHHGRTPPCVDALIAAGVSRVVAAMEDPNPLVSGNGLKMLAQSGMAVESGLLESQARDLNPGFIKRMTRGLPWVRVKLAMSLDGRTAMASGESRWITDTPARHDVQLLRARSSAVMTGIGTLMTDDPRLDVRLTSDELGISLPVRQPLRVVVDSKLRCPTQAKIFQSAGPILIMTTSEQEAACTRENVSVVRLANINGQVNLYQALNWLAEKQQVNELHVEAGSILSGALLEADLVDEVVIDMAPHIMGDSARGLFHLPQIASMNQRIGLDILDIRAVGHDWRFTARPKRRVIEQI